MNILSASDHVIIPVEATPWGLFGLANMFDFTERVREISPELDILGILVTKADERKNYCRQVRENLRELDNIRVFDSVIHVDSAVEWAQDSSSTVVTFKRASRSAKEYMQLAKEVDEICR
jgi:chromosome partitioning protein